MSDAVVLQTARLGDAVLTTPLLEAAARRHAAVDLLTTPAAAPLLTTHPAVRRVLHFDKRGTDRGLAGILRTARRLRARSYTAAYHPQGSVRSALVARLAGIPRRVGFAHAPGQFLYTDRVPDDHGRHETERLAALVDPAAPSALTLTLTARDHAAADAVLRTAGVREPFAVLAPGSARATKRWPGYAELATRLEPDLPVLVLGTPEELRTAVPPYRRTAMPPLRTSAAIIAGAAVAVTNDSLALHLAQAVGTPVVALFGPTDPVRFGPRGPHDRVLRRTPIARLPVDAVYDAVHATLSRSPTPAFSASPTLSPHRRALRP